MIEANMVRQGKVGVLPTDTIYGIVASAFDEKAIKRVYKIKNRSVEKKCITLISSIEDLDAFGVVLSNEQKKVMKNFWPGAVSILLPCGKAFRLPDDRLLISFLKESGPIIAPSANPEGLAPANTIEEAKNYFGDEVDFYVNGGELSGEPSTLVALDAEGKMTVLRHGRVNVLHNN